MTLGYKALRFSANAALDDASEKENAGKASDKETPKKPAEISSWMMTANLSSPWDFSSSCINWFRYFSRRASAKRCLRFPAASRPTSWTG